VEAQSISGALVGSLRRSDPNEAGPDTIDLLIERRAAEPTGCPEPGAKASLKRWWCWLTGGVAR
jgi:hypothetical protein